MEKLFTVFCRDADGTGTTWISTVEGEDIDEAKKQARFNCAWDWGYEDESRIVVIGVAEGGVNILEWDDEA